MQWTPTNVLPAMSDHETTQTTEEDTMRTDSKERKIGKVHAALREARAPRAGRERTDGRFDLPVVSDRSRHEVVRRLV